MSNTDPSRYFSPGQNLYIRDAWRRSATPRYASARVAAPGRLHFSVFDFSKMAPGLGGGGFGISTTTAGNEIVVSVGGAPDDAASVPTGQHLIALFKELVGYRGDDLTIRVPERIRAAHGGFGSNVTFNTAVLSGLNALFGSPFSVHEVWELLTQNFVENADDGQHIYVGLDTGVGEACMLYGGLVWIDEGAGPGDGRYLGNIATQDLWVVTAVGNAQKLAGEVLQRYGNQEMGDKTEADVVASACQAYQREYGPALKRLIEDKLRPALLRNDLRGLLAHGWQLNDVGNVKVLEGIYRTDVLSDLTKALRDAGALYAGMSSAGPGYFAFAENREDAERFKALLEERFGQYFSGFAVGRAGSKLTIDLASRA